MRRLAAVSHVTVVEPSSFRLISAAREGPQRAWTIASPRVERPAVYRHSAGMSVAT
jgi:hypothetical protein